MTNIGISHLDESMQKTYEWLDLVAAGLNIDDRQKAYAVTRGVLHVLRDRLTVEEAADMAAQLPLILKGVFYDGYKPAGKPEKIKSKTHFFEKVALEARGLNEVELSLAVRAVFGVLQEKVSFGELEDIRDILPEDLKDLVD